MNENEEIDQNATFTSKANDYGYIPSQANMQPMPADMGAGMPLPEEAGFHLPDNPGSVPF